MGGYASQFGQDGFLDRFIFRGLRDGVFIDVGAHDGELFSNSVFFERERGWTGLCIEPNPPVFQRLRRARRAVCIECCVAPTAGEVEFIQVIGDSEMLSGVRESYAPEHLARLREEEALNGSTHRVIKVPARPLRDLLAQQSIEEVHLLSADTEGGEADSLAALNFDRVFIHVIVVENNYRGNAINSALARPGFVPLIRLGVDTVYLNRLSPFASRWTRAQCIGLRALARAERKLRRLSILPRGAAAFPYKAPR